MSDPTFILKKTSSAEPPEKSKSDDIVKQLKDPKVKDDMIDEANIEKKQHFTVLHLMFEAATKLQMKSVPLASAAMVYHRFFSHCKIADYDPYLIAMTSLYMASKVEEDHIKLRDVINVCYRTLHKDKPPLDINSGYWSLRESVVQCELFLIRMMSFKVNFIHPHKFLLHYLKSLEDWLDPIVVERVPISHTAWAILRDSYHGDLCLHYRPEQLACAVLYFALQCHGIEVPHSRNAQNRWWEALCEDLSLEKIRTITSKIIDLYELEDIIMAESGTESKDASKGQEQTAK